VQAHAVNPQHYLTDVITKIVTDVITKIVNGHPNSQIDDLLPWADPAASALNNVA
jgi:hypothetical protein